MTGTNSNYDVTSKELTSFVERFEQLETEKKDIALQQKEVLAELTGRGYDKKAFREIVKLRKKTPEQIQEEESILDIYRGALGL